MEDIRDVIGVFGWTWELMWGNNIGARRTETATAE